MGELGILFSILTDLYILHFLNFCCLRRIFELMKITLPYKILKSQYKLLNSYVIVMNARKEAVVSIILPNKTIQSTLCI